MLGHLLRFVSPDKWGLIVDYVVETRRQLAAWGLQYLPHKSPERNHIEMMQQNGHLLDEFALSVWEALEAQLVSIPGYLFPGKRPSVYFWIEKTWDNSRKSRAICELLFDSGFTNVNFRDEEGRTAFWNACLESDYMFTDFLASKGAEIHPDAHCVYIRNIARHDPSFPRLPDWLFGLERQITRDGCRCSCSSCGCTPANILAKHLSLGHTSRRILLSVYISRLRLGSQEESWLEACRLEMFERLGMIHTCCERDSKDFECVCNQVSTGPEDSDQHLEYVLETNVLIYTKLRARFGGDLGDFLRAWWAAVDLFLPRYDTVDDAGLEDSHSYEEAPSQWRILPGLGKLHQSYEEFNEAKVWTVVQYYLAVVDSVIEFFDGQVNEVEMETSLGNQKKYDIEWALPEELYQYLSWLDVPLPIIKWLDGSKKVERPWDFEPSKGYSRAHNYDVVQSKRDWMKDSIIPLVTASAITDLNEGRKIPESLYMQLEDNGVIVEGKLRLLEDQEDIFEQSMEFLRL